MRDPKWLSPVSCRDVSGVNPSKARDERTGHCRNGCPAAQVLGTVFAGQQAERPQDQGYGPRKHAAGSGGQTAWTMFEGVKPRESATLQPPSFPALKDCGAQAEHLQGAAFLVAYQLKQTDGRGHA